MNKKISILVGLIVLLTTNINPKAYSPKQQAMIKDLKIVNSKFKPKISAIKKKINSNIDLYEKARLRGELKKLNLRYRNERYSILRR